jgi:hypothetical protein
MTANPELKTPLKSKSKESFKDSFIETQVKLHNLDFQVKLLIAIFLVFILLLVQHAVEISSMASELSNFKDKVNKVEAKVEKLSGDTTKMVILLGEIRDKK